MKNSQHLHVKGTPPQGLQTDNCMLEKQTELRNPVTLFQEPILTGPRILWYLDQDMRRSSDLLAGPQKKVAYEVALTLDPDYAFHLRPYHDRVKLPETRSSTVPLSLIRECQEFLSYLGELTRQLIDRQERKLWLYAEDVRDLPIEWGVTNWKNPYQWAPKKNKVWKLWRDKKDSEVELWNNRLNIHGFAAFLEDCQKPSEPRDWR